METHPTTVLSFKDATVVAPVISSTLAIAWEVGTFQPTGGFQFFSLSEHLVSAMRALPIALFLVCFVLAVTAPVLRFMTRPQPGSIRSRGLYRWLLCGSLIFMGAFAIYLGNREKLAFIIAMGLGAIALGALAMLFARPNSILMISSAALGLLLAFTLGIDVTRQRLNKPGELCTMQTKTESLRGRILMVGDRGALFYIPAGQEVAFFRPDEFISVRCPRPTYRKPSPA